MEGVEEVLVMIVRELFCANYVVFILLKREIAFLYREMRGFFAENPGEIS